MLFTIGGTRERPALLYGQQASSGPKVELGPGDYAVYHNQVHQVSCFKLYTQRLASRSYKMVNNDCNYWRDSRGRGVVLVNVANMNEHV